MDSNNNEFSALNYFREEGSLYFSESGLDHVRAFLGREAKGDDRIITAPFAKGQDIQDVMDEWDSHLKSIANQWPTLYEFENDLRAKVGPTSVIKPMASRLPDVQSYYTLGGYSTSAQTISDDARLAFLREVSGISGIRARSVDLTIDKMKKSTSSGPPEMVKKRVYLKDGYEDRSIYRGTQRGIPVVFTADPVDLPNWKGFYSAVCGVRGQEKGPEPKDTANRVVWMFPTDVTVAEQRVYQPIIESCQRFNIIPAWVSNDAVDDRMTHLFDTKGDNPIICTDFTKYDQHFNSALQTSVRDVLGKLLTRNAYNDYWLREIYPIKYMIPIITQMSDGGHVRVFKGIHGMASGSTGTLTDESFAHRMMQYEAALKFGKGLNLNSQCEGDDGCISYPGVTVDHVLDTYCSHGLEMNETKQHVSYQDAVYLRRWYHQDYRPDGICRGVYSTFRAIGRLRYMERQVEPDVWTPQNVELRWLSILENCKWHPYREAFVDFVMKKDRYRLGLDLPGFLDDIEKYVDEAMANGLDPIGYTKALRGEKLTGIKNWWVYNYVMSHR